MSPAEFFDLDELRADLERLLALLVVQSHSSCLVLRGGDDDG